jgi:hypothetical protein
MSGDDNDAIGALGRALYAFANGVSNTENVDVLAKAIAPPAAATPAVAVDSTEPVVPPEPSEAVQRAIKKSEKDWELTKAQLENEALAKQAKQLARAAEALAKYEASRAAQQSENRGQKKKKKNR